MERVVHGPAEAGPDVLDYSSGYARPVTMTGDTTLDLVLDCVGVARDVSMNVVAGIKGEA